MLSIVRTCVTFVYNLNQMNQTNYTVFGYHKQN